MALIPGRTSGAMSDTLGGAYKSHRLLDTEWPARAITSSWMADVCNIGPLPSCKLIADVSSQTFLASDLITKLRAS